MDMWKIKFLTLLGCLVTISFAQIYNLKTVVLDEGGKKMTAGNYTCRLSFAQPIASNILTSSNYRGIFGFWHPPYEGGVIIKEEDFYKSLSFPLVFSLSQCYPNPFNNKTIICYSLPKETEVSLEVLNTAGRVVAILVRGKQKPGYYNVTWNVKEVPKSKLPNGVYFYRFKAGEFVAIKKMVKTE